MGKLRYLYSATFIFWLASSLITPFLAVFAIEEVSGVGITEFGIATLIYYVSFGISVVLLGSEADRVRGLKDEFEFSMIGFLSRGILFILFAFIANAFHLYMIHFFLGLSRGFSDSVKEKIQLKLTSKGLISTSFSLKDGIVNIAAAMGAGIGGYATEMLGFRPVMLLTGMLTILSGLVFAYSVRYLKKYF